MRFDYQNHPNTILSHKLKYKKFIFIQLILLILVLLIITYKYPKKYSYEGWLENNKISVIVDENYFKFENDILKVNGKELDYKVLDIIPYTMENGKEKLWKLVLKIELPKKWNVANHYFNLDFYYGKTSILCNLIEKWKGVNT